MKKKLLTLVFTLVLLIGLVAAMGMNASAATAVIDISAATGVSNYADLVVYLDQLRPKIYIKLTSDIEVTDDARDLSLPVDASGTFVLDLNGYDIIINSDNTTSIFNVGSNFSTEFHVINSASARSEITLNSIADNASVFYINDARSSLHIYDNISINVAADGRNYFYNPSRRTITYGIRAGAFDTIAIHGADIYNRSAFGGGVLFSANVPGSKFIIDGDTEITSRFVGLNFAGIGSVTGYPDIQLEALHLEYDNADPPVDNVSYNEFRNYTAIGGLASTKTKDIIGPSMQAFYGTSEPYSRFFSNDGDLINNLPRGNNLRIYATGCGHKSGYECYLRLFVPGQIRPLHFTVCSYCGKKAAYNTCTFVTKAEATSEAHGHTAGYDCYCGYKTAKTLHYYTEYAKKAATCTTSGNKETMYVCRICTTYYDSNKNQIHGKAFLQNRIDPLGHDMVKVAAKKATTTADGNIEYYDCSRCDHISSDAEGKIAIETAKVTKIKSVTLSKTEYTYNGKEQKPSVTVKDSAGKTLKNGTDYKVTYESGRKKPGKYSVRVDFMGKYSGTTRVYYTIAPKVTSKVTIAQSTKAIKLTWEKVTGATGYRVYQYNTKTKKWDSIKTTTSTSYKVEKLKAGTIYKFRIKAYKKDDGTIWGKATETIETATKCKTPSISKLTSSKKGVASLTWTNVSGESGYQVYYSTKKDSGYKKVKSYKTNVVKGSKSKLKSGKKYYFKVRAYKKTASGTVYSSWSAVKSVKIK